MHWLQRGTRQTAVYNHRKLLARRQSPRPPQGGPSAACRPRPHDTPMHPRSQRLSTPHGCLGALLELPAMPGMPDMSGMPGIPPGMPGIPPGMPGIPPGMPGIPPGMPPMPAMFRCSTWGPKISVTFSRTFMTCARRGEAAGTGGQAWLADRPGREGTQQSRRAALGGRHHPASPGGIQLQCLI